MSSQDAQCVELKMLGALIPDDLHQQFRKVANQRGDKVYIALQHAARLYIAAEPIAETEGEKDHEYISED